MTTTFETIKNFFGAALPIVALESPSVEELTTIEQILLNVANPLKLPVYVFDIAAGLRQVVQVQTESNQTSLTEQEQIQPSSGIDFKPIDFQIRDPLIGICEYIESFEDKGLFVLVDFHRFLDGDRMVVEFHRYIKHLALELKRSRKRIVLLGQGIKLGTEFSGLVYEATNYLPGLAEIQEAVNLAIDDMRNEYQAISRRFTCLAADYRQEIFAACQGLTIEEILNVLRVDMRSRNGIDPYTAEVITQFKITKLEKLNIKFSLPPDVAPGGVETFKRWVQQRKRLFNAVVSQQQTKLKLPIPKGCLIVGPSGTGKSLLAKTLGHSWNVPILQVDIGSFYSSLVGETEANFRQFTSMVEHVGPCVILFDEIEKALAGVGSQSTDSGVSQRLFGSLLTWMNDKTSPCFVVATANNIESLPPEFKRKGRFDEIWFVDLPNQTERGQILSHHLMRHGVQLKAKELVSLSNATEDFVGAELRQVVYEAAILAVEAGLDTINQSHLLEAIAQTTPLARSQTENLVSLRSWAKTSARFASPVEDKVGQSKAFRGRSPQILHENDQN
jgi:hypothetical protein